MSTTIQEMHRLLEALPEEELVEVRDFVKVLLDEPEDLTERELRNVQRGEEEFRKGEWAGWEKIRPMYGGVKR